MLRKLSIKQSIFLLIIVCFLTILSVSVLAIYQLKYISVNMRQLLYEEGLKANNLLIGAEGDMQQALAMLQDLGRLAKEGKKDAELEQDFLKKTERINNRLEQAEEGLSRHKDVWRHYLNEESGRSIFDNFDVIKKDFGAWSQLSIILISEGNLGILEKNVLSKFEITQASIDEINRDLKIAMAREAEKSQQLTSSSVFMLILVTVTSFLLMSMAALIITSHLDCQFEKVSAKTDPLILVQSSSDTAEVVNYHHDEKSKDDCYEGSTGNNSENNQEINSGSGIRTNIENQNVISKNSATETSDKANKETSSDIINQISALKLLLDELTDQIKVSAHTGNIHMASMLVILEAAHCSLNNTLDHIRAIDDLAAQTKAFAVNASVEAARAGQYGLNFALIADEIKSTAAQSAVTAQEVISLVQTALSQTLTGTEIVHLTASTFDQIAEQAETSKEVFDIGAEGGP